MLSQTADAHVCQKLKGASAKGVTVVFNSVGGRALVAGIFF